MPSLGGSEWLNSEPLGPAGLRGRVVLVNFWTLTCINWLRQEPYVRAWSQAYRDDGLVVVGVHTPEFSFEHEPDRVRQAVEERGIDYPVALDNDYAIWRAFDNHYWPALYFVDADGIIRDQHFGEGRYEQSERDGRSDLSVSFFGATVSPEGIRQALHAVPALDGLVESFQAFNAQNEDDDPLLVVAVELTSGRDKATFDNLAIQSRFAAELGRIDRDFATVYSTAPVALRPRSGSTTTRPARSGTVTGRSSTPTSPA